jgi:outer membrane PBP1 activator LpoA protein
VAKLGDALIARKQILLARLAFGRDDPVAAAAALAPTRALDLAPELAAERDGLLRQLPGTALAAMPAAGGDFVAVLLPYGGELDVAAQAITAGLVAARLADPSGPPLRFYASGDDAVSSYRQAVADGAAVVIGPLQKAEVRALAAAPLARPTLALNNPGHTSGQINLYRLSLDPADEAVAGARWLTGAGYRRVAMLYVDDAWGRRLRNLYRRALQAQGGELVGAVPFDAGDTDFVPALRGLFAERLAAARGADAAAGGPQALIVVAAGADARQIVPQLAYVGLFDLPVLGTSRLWGGTINRAADADLDGLVFCDSPWALARRSAAGTDGVLAGAGQIWPQLERSPPRLVALGADAYALGRLLWQGRPVDALADGLTGALAMDIDGTLRRQVLDCARFSGGAPVLLTAGSRP